MGKIDVIETVEVDVEVRCALHAAQGPRPTHTRIKPIDRSYASSDDGRAFKPKRNQPKERDSLFEKGDEVWMIQESDGLRLASIKKVFSVKKLQKLFQGKKSVSYEYQLENADGLLFENGVWVDETQLEFSGK